MGLLNKPGHKRDKHPTTPDFWEFRELSEAKKLESIYTQLVESRRIVTKMKKENTAYRGIFLGFLITAGALVGLDGCDRSTKADNDVKKIRLQQSAPSAQDAHAEKATTPVLVP